MSTLLKSPQINSNLNNNSRFKIKVNLEKAEFKRGTSLIRYKAHYKTIGIKYTVTLFKKTLLFKNKQKEQWKKIESLETNPCRYENLTHKKGGASSIRKGWFIE